MLYTKLFSTRKLSQRDRERKREREREREERKRERERGRGSKAREVLIPDVIALEQFLDNLKQQGKI